MEWVEVSATVKKETAESVTEVLSRYAHRGVAIEAGPDGWNSEPVIVRAYLPADDQLWANKQEIKKAFGHLSQIQPIPAPTFRPIADEDWTELWKERLDVLHIGRHIVIRPSWREYVPERGDIVIQLDPGMAFGTGLHPTTQMCLTVLEEKVQPGAEVLDLGAGSGILAIAAAMLGARRVLAVDNDPTAVKAARENAAANGVDENVKLSCGSLPEVSGCYDLVAVNILAKVIVEMSREGLAKRVRPGGILIATGILADQEPKVVTALEQEGLTLIERRQTNDWVCLVTKLNHPPAE